MRQSIATPNIPPDDTDVDISAALPTATTDTVAGRTAAPPPVSRKAQPDNAGTRAATSIAAYLGDTETPEEVSTPHIADKRVKRTIDRGLVAVVPPNVLRHTIRLRALSLANRFRVIRTIDVAIACFPERPIRRP